MVLPTNMYVLIALKGKDIRRVVTSEDPEWLRSIAEDPEFDPESNKFLIVDEGSSDPEGSGKDVVWYERPTLELLKEKYRDPIDFGVYESLGDGSGRERVRYKTVEEVRKELIIRLNAASDGYEYPDDFLKLDDVFDRWDTFPNPNRLKHIACYVVTGKRENRGSLHPHRSCDQGRRPRFAVLRKYDLGIRTCLPGGECLRLAPGSVSNGAIGPNHFTTRGGNGAGRQALPKVMNVKVYQMKDGEKYHGLRFRELPDDVSEVDLRDYDLVWDGLTTYPESSDIQILNYLFHKLNVGEKPISYRGHSLSVSDLVALEDRLYCCQSIGWKPVAVMVRRSVRPSGGDAVRLALPWRWGLLPAGSIGIIGGITDEECEGKRLDHFQLFSLSGKE